MITAMLLGSFAMQSMAVQPKYEDYTIPGKKIKLWCIIEFGRKKFDCTRFSICRISGGWVPLSVTIEPTEKNSAYGEVYMDGETFVVEFILDNLRKDTKSTYFADNFIMEDSFEVPREILDKLKYDGDYIINQGDYPILETKSRLIVRF